MTEHSFAEQIIDLQSRLSFQEDAIQVMSQQMAQQAESLGIAEQHIRLLNDKLNELLGSLEGRASAAQERPPHY